MQLRRELGDRTFEAGLKLLQKGAIQEVVKLSDSAHYARVKDSGTKIVLFRDRDGSFDATCDCSKRPMGCKHCAAVYMQHIGFSKADPSKDIEASIDELARISFDPEDHDIDLYTAMYEFYNYIQGVIDKRIKSIGRAIEQSGLDKAGKTRLYRELWDATDRFESPHDEWSKESIEAYLGVEFYDDEERSSGLDSGLIMTNTSTIA